MCKKAGRGPVSIINFGTHTHTNNKKWQWGQLVSLLVKIWFISAANQRAPFHGGRGGSSRTRNRRMRASTGARETERCVAFTPRKKFDCASALFARGFHEIYAFRADSNACTAIFSDKLFLKKRTLINWVVNIVYNIDIGDWNGVRNFEEKIMLNEFFWSVEQN